MTMPLARHAICIAERNNMSKRTLSKNYKTMFKLEDALQTRGAM
jgi:hypothetical protein